MVDASRRSLLCAFARAGRASVIPVVANSVGSRRRHARLPQVLERIGERFGKIGSRRADAPAKSPERWQGKVVEGDGRQLEQRLETQRQAVGRDSRSCLLRDPVAVGHRWGQRHARAEDTLRRHPEADQECAAAGLDVPMATTRPSRVEMALPRKLADVGRQPRPIPDRGIESKQVGGQGRARLLDTDDARRSRCLPARVAVRPPRGLRSSRACASSSLPSCASSPVPSGASGTRNWVLPSCVLLVRNG